MLLIKTMLYSLIYYPQKRIMILLDIGNQTEAMTIKCFHSIAAPAVP